MLTDSKIKGCKPREKAYKQADAGGLYLFVTPAGGRLWRLKYRIDGKENTVTFGSYSELGLSAARIAATEARALVAQGIHPTAHKKALQAAKKAEEMSSFGAVVGADPNLSHCADPILSQGRKPVLWSLAVDKCRSWPGSLTSSVLC